MLSSPGKCRTSKKLSKEEARKVWRARLQITPRLHPLSLHPVLPFHPVRRYITAGPRAHSPRTPTILCPRPLNAGVYLFSALYRCTRDGFRVAGALFTRQYKNVIARTFFGRLITRALRGADYNERSVVSLN